MCKQTRLIRDVLNQYDFTPYTWRRKNHHVIHAKHASGRTAVFVAAATQSDCRAMKNFEALVRRQATLG